NGRKKLEQKNMDLLFANNASKTFDSETIAVTAISAKQEKQWPESNKNVVARKMLKLVAAQLNQMI
ncbi:MAG: phosphopantothenoylcysteine decarboxylase, partial [Pseudomonadota bacterium]|nr:phosphopantothenoylcysteine decarboxylase [Pseudomonadota bacterium]